MDALPTQLERATSRGGEMGERVRRFDWARTELGSVAAWPRSLIDAVSLCLATSFPMVLNVGRRLVQIYNDAAIGVYGRKHPGALGMPARTNFPEFWDYSSAEQLSELVFRTGDPFHAEDQRLLLNRNGLLQETYFTFALSPVLGDDGAVLGILNTYVETTGRVIGERRLATLHALAEHSAQARDQGEAARDAVRALAKNPYDLRFVLLYLVGADGASAILETSAGVATGDRGAPRAIPLGGCARDDPWSVARVVSTGEAQLVGDAASKIDLGARGKTSPPREALVLPVASPGEAGVAGALVVGLSPRLALDATYRGFLKLVAAQIATALGTARAYEEARLRVEKLEELDRAKSAFYGNVSHEFRTPLTLLLGPLDDLLRGASGAISGDQRVVLEAMRRNALRLYRLVDGLLDIARIEAGRFDLAPEPTDLGAATRAIASELSSAASAAGLALDIECAPFAPVLVDRDAWDKIVANLLSNAIKYTRAGSVSVRLEAKGDRVTLTVQDTGVGIPKDALPHVFERFYRAPAGAARSLEGTGIGLALVRDLVRMLGGTIAVESEEGRGSTFTVAVPRKHAPEGANVPAPPRDARSWRTRAVVAEAESWAAPSEAAAREGGRTPKRRIVVAEDNADVRQYLARLLRPTYDVEAVADGRAALDAATRSPPAMVLSDVIMPGLDGFALVRALRSDPRTRAVPIVLLTARAEEEASIEGLGAGADDYLVKPFSSRELLARVRTHVDLAEARRDAAESQIKDTIIGIAAHELRTPLTALRLQLELTMRELRHALPSTSARLDAVHRAILRMDNLVDELLSLSALKADTLTVQRTHADLGAICRQAVDEQQMLFQRKVTLDVRDEPLDAFVDPSRMRQVVTNLVSNALKYSGPDSPVVLAARRSDHDAVIEVNDRGAGIPNEEIPHLFERFHRVPGIAARAGSRAGLGIGLYITKTIVEQHGGRIEVESALGRGSTFRVVLPSAHAEERAS